MSELKYNIGIEIEGCETEPLTDIKHFRFEDDSSIQCKEEEGTSYKGNEYILNLKASDDAVADADAVAVAVADADAVAARGDWRHQLADAVAVADADAVAVASKEVSSKDASYEASQAVETINRLATIPTKNDLYNVTNLRYLKNEIDKIEVNFFSEDIEKCGKSDFYEMIVRTTNGEIKKKRQYLTHARAKAEATKAKRSGNVITVEKMIIQDSTCGLHIHMSIETDSLKKNNVEGLKYICRLYDSWLPLQSKFIEAKYNTKSLYQDTHYSEQNKEYPKGLQSKELWEEFKEKINSSAEVNNNYELLFFYINGYKCEDNPKDNKRNYFTLVTNPDDYSIHVEFRGFAVRSQLYNMICYICINLKDLFNKALPNTAGGGSKSKYLNKKKNRRKYTSNKKNRRK